VAAPHIEAAEAYGPVRGEAVRIVLCVLTLHRPVGLARCLDAIAALELPDEEAVDLRVVVVDNDAGCSGRRVVEQVACPWPVDYLVEPDRGIPRARNRALAAAGDTDLVGFVDDDEAPAPDWLVAMLDARRRTGAAVLMGRSIVRFVEAPAPWVVEGGFFQYERFTSGDSFPFWYARTSGILIDRTALPVGRAVFDDRFRLSGGSDLHLFSRMHEAGHRFAWVDEAVVEETVPATRATLGWLVRRTYRYGTTSSLTLVAEGASPLRRARRLTGAFVFTAIGLVRQVRRSQQTSTRVTAVRVLLQLAYGAGLVTGVLGVQYPEYRRVHGR
jgi:cellulose synthase/poly-beta-1,6-N-acetylglucosamine synthase-like glycosyltransferase